MRSLLSLPPALQAVWTAVYAATVQGVHASNVNDDPLHSGEPASMAESAAWEAVRRANGGEMPGEQEREEEKRTVVETRAADEPTDEEMAEALAPIVAAAHSGNAWANWPEQDRPYKIARFELLLQNDKVSADLLERQLVDAALASWKAARAWGRK